MPTIHTKEEIVSLVQALPDEVTLDDVIDRLILIRKVNTGLAQAGAGIPQSVAEAEFLKPRHERSWNNG